MPRTSQLQIFQRSFSTKGKGRGLGTYSIKLLTERYLKGTASPPQRRMGQPFRYRFPHNWASRQTRKNGQGFALSRRPRLVPPGLAAWLTNLHFRIRSWHQPKTSGFRQLGGVSPLKAAGKSNMNLGGNSAKLFFVEP